MAETGSISQSPRRLRAKYTHRTNQRFVLRIFRPAGSYCSRKRQLVRKRMPEHPLTKNMAEFTLLKKGGSAYRKKFIYPIDEIK